MAIVTVTDASFHADVIGASTPVVVDFWAEWCPPCKAIEPSLGELATEFDGRVRIARLNTDENQAAMMRYGVRSLPTLILFRNGEAAAIKVGAAPKKSLAAWIEGAIA